MEILGTKRFIPKGFDLGTSLSWPNRSIVSSKSRKKVDHRFSTAIAGLNIFGGGGGTS